MSCLLPPAACVLLQLALADPASLQIRAAHVEDFWQNIKRLLQGAAGLIRSSLQGSVYRQHAHERSDVIHCSLSRCRSFGGCCMRHSSSVRACQGISHLPFGAPRHGPTDPQPPSLVVRSNQQETAAMQPSIPAACIQRQGPPDESSDDIPAGRTCAGSMSRAPEHLKMVADLANLVSVMCTSACGRPENSGAEDGDTAPSTSAHGSRSAHGDKHSQQSPLLIPGAMLEGLLTALSSVTAIFEEIRCVPLNVQGTCSLMQAGEVKQQQSAIHIEAEASVAACCTAAASLLASAPDLPCAQIAFAVANHSHVKGSLDFMDQDTHDGPWQHRDSVFPQYERPRISPRSLIGVLSILLQSEGLRCSQGTKVAACRLIVNLLARQEVAQVLLEERTGESSACIQGQKHAAQPLLAQCEMVHSMPYHMHDMLIDLSKMRLKIGPE